MARRERVKVVRPRARAVRVHNPAGLVTAALDRAEAGRRARHRCPYRSIAASDGAEADV